MRRFFIGSLLVVLLAFFAGSIFLKSELKRDLQIEKEMDGRICRESIHYNQREKPIALRRRFLFESGDRQIIYTIKAVAIELNFRLFWTEEGLDEAIASICRD